MKDTQYKNIRRYSHTLINNKLRQTKIYLIGMLQSDYELVPIITSHAHSCKIKINNEPRQTICQNGIRCMLFVILVLAVKAIVINISYSREISDVLSYAFLKFIFYSVLRLRLIILKAESIKER